MIIITIIIIFTTKKIRKARKIIKTNLNIINQFVIIIFRVP